MKSFNRFYHLLGQNKKILTHLTDVEGHWEYFSNWARKNPLLSLDNNDELAFRRDPKYSYFVYGGDAIDRGPGDFRILNALVTLKKRYPDRVTLLVGNRESKCIRFTDELNPQFIKQRILTGPVAWWSNNISPRQFLQKNLDADDSQLEITVAALSIEDCQTIYLKWMLFQTMGCRSELFEFRRNELALLNRGKNISDVEVTQSFIQSVSQTGLIYQYLDLADLAYIHDDTLFVHGAVTAQNYGHLLSMNETDPIITNTREWVKQLNLWYRSVLKEWQCQPTFSEIKPPGHRKLDCYNLYNPKSIVTNNFYDREGHLAPVNKIVAQHLVQSGIHRVIAGHQPFGDFPLIIRDDQLELIVADTGYSDPTSKDNRGIATHQLLIESTEQQETLAKLFCTRANGEKIDLDLSKADKLIGRFTEDNWLISAKTPSGKYICRKRDPKTFASVEKIVDAGDLPLTDSVMSKKLNI